MDLATTLVFSTVIGACVAVAVWVRERTGRWPARLARCALAVAFWPLFLPLLLARPPAATPSFRPPPPDAAAGALAGLAREFELARATLEQWPGGPVDDDTIGATSLLLAAIEDRRRRILDMDAVLAALERPPAPADAGTSAAGSAPGPSEHVRRLRTVRDRAVSELLATVAWVRELLSMLHVARFTGAPAARVREIMDQVREAVQGLSAAPGTGGGT